MIEGMHGPGMGLAKLALDAAALRHQAIAHNLANLNSEDYVPLGVRFDAQLRGAQARLVREMERGSGPRPQDVDVEMTRLAENTIHYQALLRGLALQMAILRDAVGEGGRP